MSKLDPVRFLRTTLTVPLEVFSLTETTIGRAMTVQERQALRELFCATVGFHELAASRPSAVQVRDCLRRIAKKGALPIDIVTPEQEISARIEAADCRLAEMEPNRLVRLTRATAIASSHPAAGDAVTLKAIETVTRALVRNGVEPKQASAEQVRHAADGLADGLKNLIRKGRESRDDELGLLIGWAELAEHVGLRASASYKPAKRKHHSPMLTWLTAISAHLPEHMRRMFESNIGERMEHALQFRQKHNIHNSLFDAG
jgi:hypothetical protein